MGITIHYNGKLDDTARRTELLDAARLYCAEQRWMYRDIDERILGQVERLIDANAEVTEIDGTQFALISRDNADTAWSPIDDSLQGLLIMTHPQAEPMWLTFNDAGELVYYMPLDDAGSYWEMKALFAKTQYGGVEAHIAMCDFLHYLQDNFISGLNVYDEGNYFESGNVSQLNQSVDTLDAGIAQLQDTLEDLDSDDPRAEYMRHVLESMESKRAKRDSSAKKSLKVETNKTVSKPEPQWKRGRGISANKN
jgi:hypothetical protein